MEINEYVRTEDYEHIRSMIAKIIDIKGDYIYLDIDKNTNVVWTFDSITKHSKDIIDLLECNDIIVIEYYVSAYKKRIIRKFIVNKCINNYITFENVHCNWSMTFEKNKWNWNESKGFNPKIISVLTKEQYIQNAYTIEKER